MRRVVVTGLGIVSSLSCSAQDAVVALRTGRSGIIHMPEMADLGLKCQVCAPVRGFDRSVLPKRCIQTGSMAAQYATAAALQAIHDASLATEDLQNERTAVIVGSMLGGINDVSRTEQALLAKTPVSRLGGTAVVKIMNSTAAGNLAAHLGIGGRSYSISSACSTGLDNIGHAFELIAQGVQDVCICGATEEDCWRQLGPFYDNWNGMPANYNDRPSQACRPYDRDRSGMVLSAGAGIIVLETLSRAQQRGVHVYAEIVGYGSANDGSDMFAPNGKGSARSARQSLDAATRLGVGRIDYVNTHGTATKIGDKVEIALLKDLFPTDPPLVSSTKALSGHAMAAAGAIETVFTLLMLDHGFVCATANLENIDPDCEGVPHVLSLVEKKIQTALKLSLGLGGTNASLIFRRLGNAYH